MPNWFQRQIASVKKGCKNIVDSCGDKIHDWIDNYEAVLREGDYQTDSRSVLDRLFSSRRRDSLDSAHAIVSSLSRNATKEIFKRIIVTSAIVALASNAIYVGIACGAATLLISAYQYNRAKKSRNDVIEELNVAGQHVKGTRGDLCRLRVAQEQITNITDGFRPGMMKTVSDVQNDIVRGVSAERARVTVINNGKYNADVELYDFSEKEMKLMNYVSDLPQRKRSEDSERPTATDFSKLDLAKAWEGKRAQPLSEAEIVNGLVAIHLSISDSMQQEVIDKVAAAKAAEANPQAPRLQ